VGNAGGDRIFRQGWNTVINTNPTTWYMMQAAAQQATISIGSIVNIVVVTTHGLYGIAHSVAARSGVIGLSRTVAVEWAPLVSVVVAPGAIETEGWNVYTPGVVRLSAFNPMMRAGSPWDSASSADRRANSSPAKR
jgi:citronellol/citronellal dehydrogenase